MISSHNKEVCYKKSGCLYLDAGKDQEQKEKGAAEAETVGWHHQLDGHEFEQTLGDGEEQGRLVCYSPQGCREEDTT